MVEVDRQTIHPITCQVFLFLCETNHIEQVRLALHYTKSTNSIIQIYESTFNITFILKNYPVNGKNFH